MGHNWKNESRWEIKSHLKKWVTLGKMTFTKNDVTLINWVILGKVGHTRLRMRVTLGEMVTIGKRVTLGNRSHL